MAMQNEPIMFWPMPRDLLNRLEPNEQEIHRLRALITYKILFGGRLVIRDSDYLHSLGLRRELLDSLTNQPKSMHSGFFRALIDEGLIVLARRSEKSLGDVAEQLGHNNPSAIVPHDWYHRSAEDIDYLENNKRIASQIVQYSVAEAATYYTMQMQKLLNRSLGSELPDDIRERMLRHVEEEIGKKKTLSWQFFSEQGGVWKAFTEQEKQKYATFVYQILSQSPHTTFIPDRIGLSPIYSVEHAKGIHLWRGRHLTTAEVTDQKSLNLGESFTFSQYIDFLSVLTCSRLIHLLESPERESFVTASFGFANGAASLEKLEDTYICYRKIIDAELLKARYAPLRKDVKADLRTVVREGSSEGAEELVDIILEEVVGQAIPLWKLGLTLGYRIVKGEWKREAERRAAREGMADVIAAAVADLSEDQKISGRLFGDVPGARDTIVFTPQDVCTADAKNAGF